MHCSVESLGCALSVSKYCRDVVLESLPLRRALFLEPAPATEHLEVEHLSTLPGGTSGGVHRYIVEEPSETSRVIAKAHPMLIPITHNVTFPLERSLDWAFPHALDPKVMENATRSALLFQPPSKRVSFVVCHGRCFLVESAEGVTFGAILDHLDQQRKNCWKIIEETAELPYTLSTRAAYASAVKLLEGPLREDWSECPQGCEEQYVYFEAEDTLTDNNRDVWMARNHPRFAGW